jgi:ketosteroid isomerase-like protein
MEVRGETHVPNWIADTFEALDRGDVDGFCKYLSEDVDFIYASEGVASGLDEVRGFVQDFVSSIESSNHQIREVMTSPNRVWIRGDVTYERLDGSKLHVPFADVFEMDGREIDVYQVYVDQDL